MARVTVLPHAMVPSWRLGPPQDPMTKFGRRPDLAPRVDLVDAILAHHDTDAHIQDLGDIDDDDDRSPRVGSTALVAYGHRLYRRHIFADFDTTGHAPWPDDVDLADIQRQVVAALTSTGLPPHAVYVTRAGVRAIWELDRPVEACWWSWFTRWVASSGLAKLTRRKVWTDIGLQPGALDVLQCRAPGGLFRLPHVRRDGADLTPPTPYIDRGAPQITVGELTDADAYTVSTGSGLGDAPDVPGPLDPQDTLWVACGLDLWAGLAYFPTSEEWDAARSRPTWPLGMPTDPGDAVKGIRSMVASLAGRAVNALDRIGGRSPEDIAETVYRVLAPLAVACRNHPDGHLDTAEYLWACLDAFTSTLAEVRAADPTKPLVVAVEGESGYRYRTPEGDYRRVRKELLVPVLRRAHRALPVPKATPDAWAEYGRLGDVRYSFIAPSAFVPSDSDPQYGTLTVNTAPLLDIAPRNDPLCDTYLRLFLGRHYDAFTVALGGLRRLDLPAAAWFLCGEGGTGKEMLIRAVAGQFGAPPVAFEKVAQKHNDDLLTCPVVWVDEEVPAGIAPAVFREITGNRVHDIEPKGERVTKLEGYLRVFVASNGQDPVGFARALQGEAEDGAAHRALAQRIRYVDITGAPRAFLEGHGNFRLTQHWVVGPGGGPGRMVCHLRHLMDHAPVEVGATRFVAQATDDTWLERLAESGGVEGDLVGAIVDIVTSWDDPSMFMRRRALAPAMHLTEAGVWIRSPQLREAWSALMGEGARPWRRSTLNTALGNLDARGDGAGRKTRAVVGWGRSRAYLVPLAALTRAAEAVGIDPEAISDVLWCAQHDTPTRGKNSPALLQ